MSSQGQDQAISVLHAPGSGGYRLIELPPEVESLLESESPPLLTLDASDTSALLKTPQKTYFLRQKNTSNALVLLKPYTVADSSQLGLAAISTIQETVELVVVPDQPAGAAVPVDLRNTGSKGKWHERFGRNR